MFLATIADVVKDIPTTGLIGGCAVVSVLVILGIMAWTAHQNGYRLGFFDGWKRKEEEYERELQAQDEEFEEVAEEPKTPPRQKKVRKPQTRNYRTVEKSKLTVAEAFRQQAKRTRSR